MDTEIDDRGPELEIKKNEPDVSVEAPSTDDGENVDLTATHENLETANKIDSFSTFNKARKGIKDESVEDKVEAEKKEEGKEQNNKDEKTILSNKEDVVIEKPKKARDYSGLNDDEVKIFKRMGQEAFEHQKPIYLEYKKLKEESLKPKPKTSGDLPDSYYEHPEGYMLSPEYKVAAQQLAETEIIRDHWKMQEINIKRNGKFQQLFRNESGQLQLGETKEATEQDELNVSKYADASREMYIKQHSKVDALTSSFKEKHNTDLNFIKQAEAQYFKGYEDEKHPTYTLQKNILASMPASLQKHPLAGLLAKTGAANAQLMGINKVLREELAKIKGIKEDEEAAPLVKKNFVGRTNGNMKANPISSFSDFNKARKGIL